MSSATDDRRPFAKAMQNYHLMDVDSTSSQASLNIPEDIGKRYRAGDPGTQGINVRFLFFIISIIFFILSLILFIGTIVAYYNRPLVPEPHEIVTAKQFGNETQANQTNVDDSNTSRWESGQWSASIVNGRHVRPGKLIWSEEFEFFNRTAWSHIITDSGNQFCFNVNNQSNSFVSDGKLFLKPTYTENHFGKNYTENGSLWLGKMPSEKCKNNDPKICWKGSDQVVHPIMTPMISSKDFFKFKYGKLQINAKMPSGDWIEPIISLQPEALHYGDDLRSGQVHFIDTRGNRKLYNIDGTNVGSEQNCPDIRFGNNDHKTVLYYCLNTEEDEGFDTDFHLYELEWTPEKITLKIDGEGVIGGPYPRPSMFKVWSKGQPGPNPWYSAENSVMAPFDKSFYLTIGISVGGVSGFFSDDFVNKPYQKPWNNTDINAPKAFWDAKDQWEPTWANKRSALQIDFIRFYSLNETILSD